MNAEDLTTVIRAITMCTLALVIVASLCGTLFFKTEANTTTLVTIASLAGTCIGYLAGKRSPNPTNGNGNGNGKPDVLAPNYTL